MIGVGNNYPHISYNGSHIAAPASVYAKIRKPMLLKPEEMVKVSDVYVGSRHVYPELFRYTLKYRNRLSFTFHGNVYPGYRYAEAITVGYIEDTVRLNTVYPTFIRAILLSTPEDYYVPSVSYDGPVLGRNELYRDYSGMEYLITPPCALYCRAPIWSYHYNEQDIFAMQLYRKYTKDYVPLYYPPHMGDYSIILERTVHSHTVHPVYRNWKLPEEYSTDYTIRARYTCSPFVYSNEVYYINTDWSYRAEMKVPNGDNINPQSIFFGFVYREENTPGGMGLYLFTDMGHRNTLNSVLVGIPSPMVYDYLTPGTISPSLNLGYTLTAPMFTGHKRIECHEDGYGQFGYTDLDGTFEVLENNNPVFATIEDYVEPFAARE